MTHPSIEQRFAAYAQAKNRGELEVAMGLWHPDATLDVVPLGLVLAGRDDIAGFFAALLDAIGGYQGCVEGIAVDEDRLVAWWQLSGVHTGPLLDLPATHARLSVPVVSLVAFRDGLISGERLYFDLAALLGQAGLPLEAAETLTSHGPLDDEDGEPGPDPVAFVRRFQHMWQAPQPEQFAALFTHDATLLHPTMDQPLPREAIPGYVEQLKALAPDIRLEIDRWAAQGREVLIEWTITASYHGDPVELKGADRFTLRGDHAVEGVAYFDTLPLWQLLDTQPGGELLQAASS